MRSGIKSIIATVTVFIMAAAIFSCKNPLLSVIEEEVKLAVTPPAVSSVFPENGASDVAITTSYISIDFTKPIASSTVSGSSISITDSGGNKLNGSWSVNDTTVTFTPNGVLLYSETYKIEINDKLLDTDSNSLAGSYSWTFTTGLAPDVTKPQIDGVLLESGALWSSSLELAVDITAEDDYSVAQMNINDSGWVAYASSGVFSLSPGDGIRTVTVQVKDGSGNVSDPFESTIKIDTVAPQIGYLNINDGKNATNTPVTNLSLGAEDEGGSGPAEYRYRTSGAEWGAWAELISGSAEVANINLTIGLNETEIFEAQVRDVAGNISSITTAGILYETTPPAILSKQPDGVDADNYPSNAGIVKIKFNEELDTASVTPGSFYIMSGTTPLGDASIVISEDKTELQLVGFSLEKGADYTVMVEGTVSDVAGNALADSIGDYAWSFHAGNAVDTAPPDGTIVLDTLVHPSITVTDTEFLTLEIKAEDEYNLVDGMKIWGRSDGSNDPVTGLPFPRFEEQAVWLEYAESKTWVLPAAEGFYSIHYKFMDVPQNIMEDNLSLNIALDLTDPSISEVSVTDYTGFEMDDNGTPEDPEDDFISLKYTNNPDRQVTFVVDADDAISGIKDIWVSTDGALDTEESTDWAPIQTLTLPEGDGLKTIIVGVRDYVGRPLAAPITASEEIVLDLTPPTVEFGQDDYLNVNTATAQPGNFTDVNGIVSYGWEMVSGPGTVFFSDETADSPDVSANTDGTYSLKVTVEDPAGNTSFGTVPFVWDTEAPEGSIVLDPLYFSTQNQPEWSWASSTVTGSDFYRLSVDDPDFSSYTDTDQKSFIPSAALSEGAHTLYIKAMDDAQNETPTVSQSFFIDTEAPVFADGGESTETNGASQVVLSADVTDPNGTSGSGIVDVSWTKESGLGNLVFFDDGDEDVKTTAVDVPGDENDAYVVRCTATDAAGNESTAFYTLVWDTEAPGTPAVESPGLTPHNPADAPSDPALTVYSRTPNLFPAWSWVSGGEGSGIFYYRLESSSDTNPVSFTVVKDWTELSDTNYQLENPYSIDGRFLRLSVREKDNAGNLSGIDSRIIWLDSGFTSPPNITRTGSYLRNGEAGTINVSWSWTTGLPPAAGNTYRYRLDNSELGAEPSSTTQTDTFSFSGTGADDGVHTLYVEQWNPSANAGAGAWTGNVGTSIAEIDATDPSAPVIITRPPDITNSTTPTWIWNSGGSTDASGYFRYSLNGGSSWSYTYSTSATPTLSTEDSYTFEIQERDDAGNWSPSAVDNFTLDLTPPGLDGITLDEGTTYTNDLSVLLEVSGPSGSPVQMKIWNSGYAKQTLSYSSSRSWSIPDSSDGWKYVYCELLDAAGNVSSYKYDTIYLDRTPPSVSSFSINGGSVSTTSQSVTLNSSVGGATYMRIKNGSDSFSGWYSYSSSRSWTLSPGYGAKKVTVEYRDTAGNISSTVADEIFYGMPSIKFAQKGATTNGDIGVYLNSFDNETGSANTYDIDYALSSSGTKYNAATTTGTSAIYSGNTGTLYYFFVRMYNPEIGYSSYSSHQVGFSSMVTVIYDSNDSTDSSMAQVIKNLLEDNHSSANSSDTWITGTWPVKTVTLLPEIEVSSSWYSSDERYIIQGDPVIITPSTVLYANTNKVRNIIHRDNYGGITSPATVSGGGIIAMGTYGAEFVDKVRYVMSTYGYTDQAPVNIGGDYSATLTSDPDFIYQWTTAESFLIRVFNRITMQWEWTTVYRTPWSYPLKSNYFNGGTSPVHNAQVQISYTDQTRKSVYISNDANPSGGWIYARDPYSSNPHYYTVVRQGRFMQYGFNHLADRYYTGLVYFVNLVARMDDF